MSFEESIKVFLKRSLQNEAAGILLTLLLEITECILRLLQLFSYMLTAEERNTKQEASCGKHVIGTANHPTSCTRSNRNQQNIKQGVLISSVNFS